jgi:DnaJ family protein B protein 13
MNEDRHTSSIRDNILTFCVKRGWKPGTRITFAQEGDQGPNNIPADRVFVVRDKPHAVFRRDGADLVHTAQVSLCKALTGTTVTIKTLDERTLHIPITDVVAPGYKKVVPGEGMPINHTTDERGDLIIEFDIAFPRTLKPDKKALVRKALPHH